MVSLKFARFRLWAVNLSRFVFVVVVVIVAVLVVILLSVSSLFVLPLVAMCFSLMQPNSDQREGKINSSLVGVID